MEFLTTRSPMGAVFFGEGPCSVCCLWACWHPINTALFLWVTVATGYVQINGAKWARKGGDEEVCTLVNMFTMRRLHRFYCGTKYRSTHLLGLKDTQFIWWVTLNTNTTLFVNKKTPRGVLKSKVKDAAFIIYSFTTLQSKTGMFYYSDKATFSLINSPYLRGSLRVNLSRSLAERTEGLTFYRRNKFQH